MSDERLVIVSNRGPAEFARDDNGERQVRRGGGGLVTALSGLVAHRGSLWIASGVLVALALIPGLPKLSFLLIAGVLMLIARRIAKGAPAPQASAHAAGASGAGAGGSRCCRVPAGRVTPPSRRSACAPGSAPPPLSSWSS